MKFADIVANALEICDSQIENACIYNSQFHFRWYADRQKKIRDWYLRRLIKSG